MQCYNFFFLYHQGHTWTCRLIYASFSDKVMNEVNSILAMYKGTHNFHNFTSGR